jgi:hypothetical protein
MLRKRAAPDWFTKIADSSRRRCSVVHRHLCAISYYNVAITNEPSSTLDESISLEKVGWSIKKFPYIYVNAGFIPCSQELATDPTSIQNGASRNPVILLLSSMMPYHLLQVAPFLRVSDTFSY